MRIRPGGPDDIAAVLALGDEAVKWMNARGNTRQWGTTPRTGDQEREVRLLAGPGAHRHAAGRGMAGNAARDATEWSVGKLTVAVSAA
jgi:hypothetical protein